MDGNELAAQLIRNTHSEGLSEAVQHKLKICLVDIIAAVVGGVLTPTSDITAAYATEAWQGDEATILLHDKRTRATGAAFANAYAANGLDCDDGDDLTLGHPGAQVFPTALAVGESLGCSGAEILAVPHRPAAPANLT